MSCMRHDILNLHHVRDIWYFPFGYLHLSIFITLEVPLVNARRFIIHI